MSAVEMPGPLVLALLDELERNPASRDALLELFAAKKSADVEVRWLDKDAKAAQLGCSAEVLMRWARDGRVPGAIKVAGRWRFPADGMVVLPPGRRERGVASHPRRGGSGSTSAGLEALRGIRNVGA